MIELDRRKCYVDAIENYVGMPPFRNLELAHIIHRVGLQIGDKKFPSTSTVRLWYKQYQCDSWLLIHQNQRGLPCKY